jgi:hypothetical protein
VVSTRLEGKIWVVTGTTLIVSEPAVITGQLVPGTGRASINLSIILGSITGTLKRGSFIVGSTGAAPVLRLAQVQGADIAAPAAAPAVFKSSRLLSMKCLLCVSAGCFDRLFLIHMDIN